MGSAGVVFMTSRSLWIKVLKSALRCSQDAGSEIRVACLSLDPSSVSLLRSMSLSSDPCLCPQIHVSVLRSVSLSSDPCLCPQIRVSVLRSVSLSSDPCLCPQIHVSVLRCVSLSSDPCLSSDPGGHQVPEPGEAAVRDA